MDSTIDSPSLRARVMAALLLVPALACGGAQTNGATGDGDIEPLATSMDRLGLLPGRLVDGDEPPEGIEVARRTLRPAASPSVAESPQVQVEGLVEVDELMPLAVTVDLELLIEANGERVPARLSLISYERGLHVYAAQTMTGYEGDGSRTTAADQAAAFLVDEARNGRWSTHIVSASDLQTALPSTVRMALMNHGDMIADLTSIEEVLATGRLLEARLGREVVVYARRPADLDLFQAVLEVEPHTSDELRVLGPPHVVLSRLSPARSK